MGESAGGKRNFDFWILNWAQAASLRQRGAQTCKEYGFDANAENTEPHPFYTKEAQDAFDKAELERAIR